MKDTVEYYEYISKSDEKQDPAQLEESKSKIVKNLNDITNKLNFAIFCKIVCFYFNLFKRLIERQISLNNRIINEIIRKYEKSGNNHSEIVNNDLNQNFAKVLIDFSEDLFSVINMIIKFSNDKINETINRRKIDDLTVNQFNQMIMLFEMIKSWFKTDLAQLYTIQYEEEIGIPSLKSFLNKYNNNFHKISITPLINLQSEREKGNMT